MKMRCRHEWYYMARGNWKCILCGARRRLRKSDPDKWDYKYKKKEEKKG